MDEYVGIPRDHAESYRTFMHTHFFSQIDIREENINLLDGEASDLLEECSKYEAKILKVGGIDLFLAGIGKEELHEFQLLLTVTNFR